MRVFFTFYLKDNEQKKTSTQEGRSITECESKLKEQYENIEKIVYSNPITSADDGVLYGGYLLCNSR